MAQFTKHIGTHNNRKVAIIYREVPNEEHMCLICYPDTLNKPFHDAVMKVIESDIGQAATDLADALHRNLLADGRPILETLHREGIIKKVQTNQVIVTPNAHSHVRLDELNSIFKGIESGEDAAGKMQKLDANSGIPDGTANTSSTSEGLSDEDLAKSLLDQAKSMITESDRLTNEAYALDPSLKPKAPEKKKVVKKKTARKKSAVKVQPNLVITDTVTPPTDTAE